MRIFERLKLVCEYNHWKLKDFVEKTGLPYRTAQGYLSGDREPNAEGMTIIALTLHININWLLTGVGAMFIDQIEQSIIFTEQEKKLIYQYRQCNEIGKRVIEININSLLKDKTFNK